MGITITKIFKFCYGHKLEGYKGKCANAHGHSATLEVEISGPPMSKYPQIEIYSGMVYDFKDLSAIVEKEVLNDLDHSWMNDIVGSNPTAEIILTHIVTKLLDVFVSNLIRVRLYEEENSYAEWRRD